MAISLISNVTSLRAANTLRRTHNTAHETMSRVSTGSRITSASSDAAGSAVATNLSSKIGSTRQAIRNTNDAISILQTAEGSAKEVAKIVDRARELSIQSASDTLSADERAYTVAEFKELSLEAIRIAGGLEFNGKSLGSGTSLEAQVGANTNGTTNRIKFRVMDLGAIGNGLKGLDISTSVRARQAIRKIDDTMNTLNVGRSQMAAGQNRLQSALSTATESLSAVTAASSRILDADYAQESARMTANSIRMQAGAAALGQANAMSQAVMSLI